MDPGGASDDPGDVVDADVPLLETVARNVPVVLFALDQDGIFTRSEGRALAALDLEPNDVVGQSVFDVYADEPAVLDAVERALAGESLHEVHEIDDVAFETWYRPMGDDGVEHVLGVAVDVTDRVQHERLLERLNEATRGLMISKSTDEIDRLIVAITREVLDVPSSVVWRYDTDDGLLHPVSGMEEDTTDGRLAPPYEELAPIEPDSAEMRAFHEGDPVFFEDYGSVQDAAHPESALGALLVVPIGDYGLITVGAATAADMDDATPDLAEILARDATVAIERVTRESALANLHDTTRALMEAETREEIARLTVDTTDDILGHPMAVVRLLSSDGDRLEPVARSEYIRTHLGERPSFRVGEGSIGGVYERGDVCRFDRSELDVLDVEGVTETLLCVPLGRHGVVAIGESEPLAFDESDVQLARILASNVETALDRVERERELARRNERLDQFARVVSHDLRNPLNVIAGQVDLADVGEPHRTPIDRSIEQIRSLVEDVLTLARQGRVVSDPEPVDLEDVATRAWVNLETKDATLTIEGTCQILADEGRLQRLVENLVGNAIEHGRADVTVRIGPTDGGFFVEDDGPGIPDDDVEAIFEAGCTTADDGTGFGLAIVTEIAGAHDWTVSVCTGRDGGARFDVAGVEYV